MRRDSDGKILVSLFTPQPSGSLRLERDPEIHYQGRWYSVPSMPLGLLNSLVLPNKLEAFPSARQLFFSIFELLQKHAPLPWPERSLVTYWSMATWFPDCLPLCPALVITGTASAADLLLRTLLAVCRRPLLLADVSPAVLRALPLGELMPTLLIRSSQTSSRLSALLDSSTRPGYLVSSGRDFQQFYCPKCVYVGEDVGEGIKTSSSIRVHVGGKIGTPFQPPPTEDVVRHFQNRLLAYRLLNRDQVTNSKFRISGFRPEASAIGEALGATIVDDPELQGGITLLLKAHDEQSRVDRASGSAGMVLRALLFHCHEQREPQVFVHEIAATLNRIAGQEGEVIHLSSEKVGHILKNLGLYSQRLGSNGKGLLLEKATQIRVHRLCQAYDVLAPAPACSFCQNLQNAESDVVIQNGKL
jgi:hypothetical protein